MADKMRVVIMGAAGRDFHNFNTYFRDNEAYEVVAFTATQIPNIAGRKYPAELAGKLYPSGIPIYSEDELTDLIKREKINQVVFSYSDVSHQYVMGRGEKVMAAGADFRMMGAFATMLKSEKPVVSICAVRTGSGKSQTTRRVAGILRQMGKKVVVVRHPMPYGDLVAQRCQRFATIEDMVKEKCTIEEMEEYEPHIIRGVVVYAGVDYEEILRKAEKEADIVLWDGGNNDLPFYKPDLEIVVADPHRPGHELTYYPGAANFLRADVIVINKIDTADREGIERVRESIRRFNPKAIVVDAASPLFVEGGDKIKGRRVLAIEDGPTLTHGEMKYGAAVMAAYKFGASELVDPRPWVTGSFAEAYANFDIGTLLPALGYGDKQMRELEEVVKKVDCDLVLIGTPIDLRRVIKIDKPALRVTYELEEIGRPNLTEILARFK
jgi:predicted GTPase